MWQPSWKIKQRQLNEAKRFYRADQQVSDEDRAAMAGFFRQRLAIVPLFCAPIAVSAIMFPKFLKKRGIFPKNKSTRLLQSFLAFAGIFAGVKISGGLVTSLHTGQLHSEGAIEAYHILTHYPPLLGSNYYSLSSRNKALRFKDPSTINWRKAPMFPLALVMNTNVLDAVEQEQLKVEKYQEYQKELTRQRIEGLDSERAEEQQVQLPADDFTDSENKW